MFKLDNLTSLTYHKFGELLDSSGDELYRKVMLALGVDTDKELARALGISEQAVNNAKRGGKIPDRWVMYAVCMSGFALPLILSMTEKDVDRALAERDKFTYKLVPVVKSIQHLKSDEYTKHIDSYIAVRRSIANRLDAKDDELVAAHVKGYALEPAVKRGDTMIISVSQKTFSPGGIFIINVDDTVMLCRLHKLPGKYRVMFDNPSILDFDVEHVNICGRVLWVNRDI